MKSFLRMNVAVFVILMLILTTTLGLVAVKQQQFADVMPKAVKKVSYFSLPADMSCVNPKEEAKGTELLKRLLETAILLFVSLHISFNVSLFGECIKNTEFFRLPIDSKVVLIE